MAYKTSVGYALIWMTILAGFTIGIELGEDIQIFVPICAQPCLQSFISSNYPSTDCTSNPTLQCLCPAQSYSGYTLGEGALECISIEVQQGICGDNVTKGSIKHDAYEMCSNVAHALPNTHSVLTATFGNSPTGGPGSIILTSMPTSTPTMPSKGAAATAMNGATSTSPEKASVPSLNTAQIAGIVVGVVGTILMTLIAILIVRRIRKRNYPELEEGLLPRDGSGCQSRLSKYRRSGPLVISAPIPIDLARNPEPQLPQPDRKSSPYIPLLNPDASANRGPSPSYSPSPNPDREDIGLAVSHSLDTTPSRSPEKPAGAPYSLLPPAEITPSVKPPRRPRRPEPLLLTQAPVPAALQTSRTDRTSMMTNMTAFADLDAEAQEGDQIWQPPTQPAVPSYVADKWGNWVLNNNNRQSDLARVTEAAELDTYTPLTKSPIEMREEEVAKMAAAISAASALPQRRRRANMAKTRTERPLDRSSSVYSQASAVRRNFRTLLPRKNSSRSRPNTAASHDSVTTINTCSSSPLTEEILFELDNGHSPELPTVMETSLSPKCTPIKYPPLPGRHKRSMIQLDPSKRLEFLPHGQPSPTLRSPTLPVTDTDSLYPQPLNPRNSRIPNLARNPDVAADLPGIFRVGENQLSTQSPLSRFSPRMMNIQARTPQLNDSRIALTPPMKATESGFSPNPPNLEIFPTSSSAQSQSDMANKRSRVSRSISPLGLSTVNPSSSSALLAKRVGKGKALTLNPGGKKKGTWKIQKGLQDDGAPFPPPVGPPPPTPTWQPKLTPTRFGDELYLNVQ